MGRAVLVVFHQTAVGRHLGSAFETLGPRCVCVGVCVWERVEGGGGGSIPCSERSNLKRARSHNNEEMRAADRSRGERRENTTRAFLNIA